MKTKQINLFPTIEREQLEGKYAPLIRERLDLRAFFGLLNKAKLALKWFKFKGAFSRRLVEE